MTLKTNPYATKVGYITSGGMPDNTYDRTYIRITPMEEVSEDLEIHSFITDESVVKNRLFPTWLGAFVVPRVVDKPHVKMEVKEVKKGDDIYTLEAKRIFKVNHPTDEMRNHVKWLRFGLGYGMNTLKTGKDFILPDLKGKVLRQEAGTVTDMAEFEYRAVADHCAKLNKELATAMGVPQDMLYGTTGDSHVPFKFTDADVIDTSSVRHIFEENRSIVDQLNEFKLHNSKTPLHEGPSHDWLESKFGHIPDSQLSLHHKGHYFEMKRRESFRESVANIPSNKLRYDIPDELRELERRRGIRRSEMHNSIYQKERTTITETMTKEMYRNTPTSLLHHSVRNESIEIRRREKELKMATVPSAKSNLEQAYAGVPSDKLNPLNADERNELLRRGTDWGTESKVKLEDLGKAEADMILKKMLNGERA